MVTQTGQNNNLITYSDKVFVHTLESIRGLISGKKVVSVDAEWMNQVDFLMIRAGIELKKSQARFISWQLAFTEDDVQHLVYFLDSNYPVPDLHQLVEELQENQESKIKLHFLQVPNLYKTSVLDLGIVAPGSEISLLMFYSPMDICAVVGRNRVEDWILGKCKTPDAITDINWKLTSRIEKKRKHTGQLALTDKTNVKLYDVIGTCTAGMGLEKFLESVGLNLKWKQLSNHWNKAHMEQAAMTEPTNFAIYSLGDVALMETAMQRRVNQVNEMVETALAFNPNYILPWLEPKVDETKFPMSSGALVSTTFEKWLTLTHGEILQALTPHTYAETTKHAKLRSKYLEKNKEKPPLEQFPNDGYHHPLASASIPSIVAKSFVNGKTSVFNSVVFGGRCLNENPMLLRIADILDIDLNSCYGSALQGFTLPLGFPRILAYDSNDLKRITLGEFLKQNENDLKENLWQVFVNGKLNFEQDLVYSKTNISENTILRDAKKCTEVSETDTEDQSHKDDSMMSVVERSHIRADMVMALSEIENGCITSDILRTIRAVASNGELKEFMQLEVVTAMWYAASDEYTDQRQFVANLKLQDTGWFAVPLSGFVGAFVKTRKKYKSIAKNEENASEDERHSANLFQDGLKLFINTTYGCFASPYFRMGNTVLANNITAKARLGAWMLAKALGSVQSITDGGMYSWNTCRHLEPTLHLGRKPGFHTFADYDRTNKHRCIRLGRYPVTLADNSTVTTFEQLREMLHAGKNKTEFETSALKHINGFWSHYGLQLPFAIEHKYENTGLFASYNGSANYAILGVSTKKPMWNYEHPELGLLNGIYKVRGAKSDEHHNKLELKALIIGDWSFCTNTDDGQKPKQAYTVEERLLQVGAFQEMTPEARNKLGILPGESYQFVTFYRPKDKHLRHKYISDWKRTQESWGKITRRQEQALKLCTNKDEIPLFNPGKDGETTRLQQLINSTNN